MMKTKNVKWQQMTVPATAEYLKTNASCGLSRKEARSRFRSMGANTLFDAPKRMDRRLLSLLTDPACLMTVFLVFLQIFFGELLDGLIMLPVLICAALLFCRVLLCGRQLSKAVGRTRMPSVHVIRNRHEHLTVAHNLVCGDLIILQRGDVVPADCRLVRTKDLRVMMPMTDEKGKQCIREIAKTAETVYPPAATAHPSLYENMVYGGSEISAGSALAIVVATGADCLLSGMSFLVQQEDRDDVTNGVRPYVKLFSSALFALMIPLVIIAMLYANENTPFLSVFASYATWVLCGSQAVLLFCISMPSTLHRIRYASETERNSKILYASAQAERKLSLFFDLFVLGHCGTSDGTLHLYRCAAGNRELQLSHAINIDGVQSLCEAMLLYQFAEHEASDVLDEGQDKLQTLCDELLSVSGFDAEALATRLTDCRIDAQSEDVCLLDVRMKNGEFRLLFSNDPRMINRCTFYEKERRTAVFANADRDNLYRFCKEIHEESAETVCIVKQVGTQMIFLGVLALRERLLTDTRVLLEDIRTIGVRTTFFLREPIDAARRYARAVGLPEPISAEGCGSVAELAALVMRHRVICGLASVQIAELVKHFRNEHKRIGVLGSDCEDVRVMRAASLSVSAIYEPKKSSPLATARDAIIIRQSDVSVFRNKEAAGGLSSLAEGIKACRAVLRREELIFRFLILSQLSVFALVLLSTVFGLGQLSGAVMLYICLLCPLAAAFWFSILPVVQKRSKPPKLLDSKCVQTTLADLQLWLPPVLTLSLAVVGVFLFKLFALTDGAGGIILLLSSLLLCEICSVIRVSFSAAPRFTVKRSWLPVLLMTLPVAILLLLCTLFPRLGASLGIGGFSWIMIIFLLLIPLFYWSFCRLISSFFDRTAK